MYEYILDGKIILSPTWVFSRYQANPSPWNLSPHAYKKIVSPIFTSQVLSMVFPLNPGEEYFSASL